MHALRNCVLMLTLAVDPAAARVHTTAPGAGRRATDFNSLVGGLGAIVLLAVCIMRRKWHAGTHGTQRDAWHAEGYMTRWGA